MHKQSHGMWKHVNWIPAQTYELKIRTQWFILQFVQVRLKLVICLPHAELYWSFYLYRIDGCTGIVHINLCCYQSSFESVRSLSVFVVFICCLDKWILSYLKISQLFRCIVMLQSENNENYNTHQDLRRVHVS